MYLTLWVFRLFIVYVVRSKEKLIRMHLSHPRTNSLWWTLFLHSFVLCKMLANNLMYASNLKMLSVYEREFFCSFPLSMSSSISPSLPLSVCLSEMCSYFEAFFKYFIMLNTKQDMEWNYFMQIYSGSNTLI